MKSTTIELTPEETKYLYNLLKKQNEKMRMLICIDENLLDKDKVIIDLELLNSIEDKLNKQILKSI